MLKLTLHITPLPAGEGPGVGLSVVGLLIYYIIMKKVVVAFSGGLDTSYTVMKLAKEGYEVHAACANTAVSRQSSW